MTDKILALVNEYEEKGDFTYSLISDQQIEEASLALQVEMPAQYIEFLRRFGHGGIGGIEVIGVGRNGKLLFVTETLKYREYGLPKGLIVIENCDEWVYCLDASDGKVVSWSDGDITTHYSDFDSYLLDRFSDAAENI